MSGPRIGRCRRSGAHAAGFSLFDGGGLQLCQELPETATWFINTGLYKKNLESYVAGKGMTKAAKARVMATITLLMSVGFVMMLLKALYVPCIILGCIWVFHIVYFLFGVKTLKEAAA